MEKRNHNALLRMNKNGNTRLNASKNDIAKAFIDGYQQVRVLTHEEYLAIPYYELLSVIWVMAIHANNVDRIGYKYLEKPFWDRWLSKLKELEKLLLSSSSIN